jgi:hypothetical protein
MNQQIAITAPDGSSLGRLDRLARRKLKTAPVDPQAFMQVYLELLDPHAAVHQCLLASNTDPDLRALLTGPRENIHDELHMQVMALFAIPAVVDALNGQLVHAIQATRLTTAKWVLDKAREVFEKCNQDRNILDKNNTPKLGPFMPIAALRALELVGKHVDVQAFKEVVELQSGDGLIEQLEAARQRVENRVIEGQFTRLDTDADTTTAAYGDGINGVARQPSRGVEPGQQDDILD